MISLISESKVSQLSKTKKAIVEIDGFNYYKVVPD